MKYNAKVLRVIDGDTFEVEIQLWYDLFRIVRIRLYGLDTPEIKGKERPYGLEVKDYVESLILGREVLIQVMVWTDKYGRCVARVIFDGHKDLTNLLLSEGLAEPYPKVKALSKRRKRRIYWRRKAA